MRDQLSFSIQWEFLVWNFCETFWNIDIHFNKQVKHDYYIKNPYQQLHISALQVVQFLDNLFMREKGEYKKQTRKDGFYYH